MRDNIEGKNRRLVQMSRKPGTDVDGNPFSSRVIQMVWNKGMTVPGIDPSEKRKDSCGAWIERNQYRVYEDNGTGWEIDHIKPVILGGNDDISNLQPLQWQNNRSKGNNYPGNVCSREAEAG
jgi:UDP-glucose 6-dehydrogenase